MINSDHTVYRNIRMLKKNYQYELSINYLVHFYKFNLSGRLITRVDLLNCGV